MHHEHEYNAIRNACALIDISPLYKYLVTGKDATKLLKSVAEADITNLKYFRMTSGKIAGVPVDISRTGYTGDLGYEVWIPWNDSLKVWDALMAAGKQFDIHAAGMLALDVARVEA